jgi:hypothetical protein
VYNAEPRALGSNAMPGTLNQYAISPTKFAPRIVRDTWFGTMVLPDEPSKRKNTFISKKSSGCDPPTSPASDIVPYRNFVPMEFRR